MYWIPTPFLILNECFQTCQQRTAAQITRAKINQDREGKIQIHWFKEAQPGSQQQQRGSGAKSYPHAKPYGWKLWHWSQAFWVRILAPPCINCKTENYFFPLCFDFFYRQNGRVRVSWICSVPSLVSCVACCSRPRCCTLCCHHST